MKRPGADRFRHVSIAPRRQIGWLAAIRVATAFALFLSAILVSSHHARAKEAASGDLAELGLLLGVTLDDLQSSICRQGDETSSEFPGDDDTKLCKHCPLCLALQHFAAINPPNDLVRVAYRPSTVAAFLPYRLGLIAGRETDSQAKPRAPPLA